MPLGTFSIFHITGRLSTSLDITLYSRSTTTSEVLPIGFNLFLTILDHFPSLISLSLNSLSLSDIEPHHWDILTNSQISIKHLKLVTQHIDNVEKFKILFPLLSRVESFTLEANPIFNQALFTRGIPTSNMRALRILSNNQSSYSLVSGDENRRTTDFNVSI